MEKLDLYGTTPQKAHKIFIKEFWGKFGKNGHKHYHSVRGKQETLDYLKMLGETVVLRRNTPPKTAKTRARFERIKIDRHSLKSHKTCFACSSLAEVRHHIIWIKNGGINSKRNLVSLRQPCPRDIQIYPLLLLLLDLGLVGGSSLVIVSVLLLPLRMLFTIFIFPSLYLLSYLR